MTELSVRLPARLRSTYVARRRDPHPSGTVVLISGGGSEHRIGRVHSRVRPNVGHRTWTAEVAGFSLGTRYLTEDAAVQAILVFHASYPDILPGEGECVPRGYVVAGRWQPNPDYNAVMGGAARVRIRARVRDFLAVWRVVRGF